MNPLLPLLIGIPLLGGLALAFLRGAPAATAKLVALAV